MIDVAVVEVLLLFSVLGFWSIFVDDVYNLLTLSSAWSFVDVVR